MGATLEPLNPVLYSALRQNFGHVKVDKAGRPMVRRISGITGEPEILEKGETYRVCCPYCGDIKFKLYVNYTFGLEDPHTGYPYYINTCYRCGPKTDQLKQLITWLSMRHGTAFICDADEDDFVIELKEPGECVRLDHPRGKPGWDYLAGRGINPQEATDLYGVTLCVDGNPDLVGGGMEGRLIFPVTFNGELVGWQARLARDPGFFDRDKGFKNLRWYTMPGSWKSKYLFGYDQAKSSPVAVLVEGPTDLVRQGPPCVASLGQSMSYDQARLLRSTWDHVVIVGDHRGEHGQEDEVQKTTSKVLYGEGFKSVHLVKLPDGDPGSWSRSRFGDFVRTQVLANPRGITGVIDSGTGVFSFGK